MLRIDNILDALEQSRFFSVIDLKSGYWQIPMKQDNTEKTALRTSEGPLSFYRNAIWITKRTSNVPETNGHCF